MNAIDLSAGDHIRRLDGTFGTVEAVRVVETTQPMYNFTVGTAHTYFVGDGQWLVHNACRFSPEVENFISKYRALAPQGSDQGRYYNKLVNDMRRGAEPGVPGEKLYAHELTPDHIDALLWNQAGHLDKTVRQAISSGDYTSLIPQLKLRRYRFLADPGIPEFRIARDIEISALNHPDIPPDMREQLLDILHDTLQYP